MTTVTMDHLRSLGYCARGVREFFHRYQLDYKEFLESGVDSEKLLAACNNDWMAEKAVEVADGKQQ